LLPEAFQFLDLSLVLTIIAHQSCSVQLKVDQTVAKLCIRLSKTTQSLADSFQVDGQITVVLDGVFAYIVDPIDRTLKLKTGITSYTLQLTTITTNLKELFADYLSVTLNVVPDVNQVLSE